MFKETRDFDVNIFPSKPCSSRINVTNGRENSVDVVRRFLLGEWNCEEVEKVIEEAYEKILFMLPTGAVGAVRRLNAWKHRDIEELIFEATAIQSQLNYINRPKVIAELQSFVMMLGKGNVNRVSKLLKNNMSNGTLPLDDNTLQLLHEKHPTSKNEDDEMLFLEKNHVYFQ